MVLINGKIISSNYKDNKNDIVKFDQLNIDLQNIQNRTINPTKSTRNFYI